MILDFKNRRQWTKEDKMASIGKFFWNNGELMVLAHVDTETNGTPCVVGDRYGNLRTAQWQKVAQGSIVTNYAKETVSRALLRDSEIKPEYMECVRALCAYLNTDTSAAQDVGTAKYEALKAEAERLGFEILWREINGKHQVYMLGGTAICG